MEHREYRRSFDGYRRPRSAYHAVNIAPDRPRRLTNAFGGCEWYIPPARFESIQAPTRRPAYRQTYYRSDESDQDIDGLLAIPVLTYLAATTWGGAELAHHLKPHLNSALAPHAEPVGLLGGLGLGYLSLFALAVAWDYKNARRS